MLTQLFRNWWLYAVRGVLAIVFGVMALIWPDQVKVALVLLFGAYALVDGIFTVIAGIASQPHFERWWAVLLEGVAGIGIGLLTFFWPNITGQVLIYFIAAWAIVTGIFEIVAAIELRQVITGEWALVLSGLLSILLGVLMFAFPGAGAVSVVWLIGIYAIFFGIALLIFAFRLRSLKHNIETAGATGN